MSYDQIRLIWAQILNVLKIRIDLAKMLPGQANAETELDQFLAEIVALEDLEFSLYLAVLSNRKDGFSSSEENESLLINKLAFNPI